jgi:predicted nucleic acid-binding protein
LRLHEKSGIKSLKREFSNYRILFDTKPLMKLFSKEEGWDCVQKILTTIEEGKIEAAISVVTLTEIYYKYLHEKREDLAKTRTDELKYAVYIKKLDLTEETAIKAGEFKGKYSIPIADAQIAATAYVEGLLLISDDADFKKINEVKTITEKESAAQLPK